MKIAITQRQIEINGFMHDCLDPNWYRLFKGHELIIIPNLINIDLDIDLDMLVVSGGNHSEARYKTELMVCDWAMRNGIPILGVCHGAFFLNYAFKGIDAEIKDHRNVEHTIIMEDQEYIVNSYHDVCIYELGKDLTPIAWTGDHVEAFKHKDLPIWGIVWHPERMDDPILPAELKELIYG
jgi:putative glutamine amidotransferase